MAYCIIALRVGFEKCPIPCKELKQYCVVLTLSTSMTENDGSPLTPDDGSPR